MLLFTAVIALARDNTLQLSFSFEATHLNFPLFVFLRAVLQHFATVFIEVSNLTANQIQRQLARNHFRVFYQFSPSLERPISVNYGESENHEKRKDRKKSREESETYSINFFIQRAIGE